MTIQLFELSRRAKLTEVWFCCAQEGFVRPRHALQEWADTLRHGRDRSERHPIKLTNDNVKFAPTHPLHIFSCALLSFA